jgi:hypothetical protein
VVAPPALTGSGQPVSKQKTPMLAQDLTPLLPALKQMALNRRIPLPMATLTTYQALNRKSLLLPAQQTIPFPPLNPITPLPAVQHLTPY